MSRESEDSKRLPQPPRFRRRVMLDPLQWVFLSALMLGPILALFGVFGPRDSLATASGEGIELRAHHPSVLRYGLNALLSVEVRNTLSTPAARITVRIERPFIEHFSDVSFAPQPSRVTPRDYEFEFAHLQPGEIRRVAGQVTAARHWRQSGVIAVSGLSPRGPSTQVNVSTFVFP